MVKKIKLLFVVDHMSMTLCSSLYVVFTAVAHCLSTWDSSSVLLSSAKT